MIEIGGFVPLTTIDFPGHLAAVIFCKGCPWKCSYCHNSHLQKKESSNPDQSWNWATIVRILAERKDFLEAVVFSGGEPLLQRNLLQAVQQVKSLGYRVGLHTSGSLPLALKRLLPYLDWVGLDIKAPFSGDKYSKITGAPKPVQLVQKSLSLLVEAMPHRFQTRTTLDKRILDEADQIRILQNLVETGACIQNHSWQVCRQPTR